MGKRKKRLTEEEVTALGEDLHRYQELDTAVGMLIQELKVSAEKCWFCMGPCPLFTLGAKPCKIVPENFHERNAEMREMVTELIELRKSKGLDP